MLRIGEFSMLSKISIHMLRNYDEMGLIIPTHIDDFTGYRYYNEEQLLVANKVQALKGMGLSLSDIKVILEKHVASNLYEESGSIIEQIIQRAIQTVIDNSYDDLDKYIELFEKLKCIEEKAQRCFIRIL